MLGDNHGVSRCTSRHISDKEQVQVQQLHFSPECRGYWKDRKNVEAELRKFMATHGISGRMPSCTELREAGAFTLYSAISKHGGVGAFARQLG